MSTYLIINILIILIPFSLSFEKNIRFYKKFLNVFVSIFLTGIIFIVWDMIAVKRGDWSFNKEFVFSKNLFGLPFEEILFFVTVPFSIIFIFETLKYYIPDNNYKINKFFFLIIAIVFFVAAAFNFGRYYTATVLIFSGTVILISLYLMPSFITSKIYLLTLLISFIPFLIVNFILTSLPVVIYNPEAILGVRILTIPAEDFLYSFTMITFWLLIYRLSENYEPKLFLKNDQSKA